MEKNGATVLPIYDVEPRWLKADGDKYFHPIHPVNKAPVSERFALALAGKRRKYPQIARVDYRKGGAVCFVESDAPLNGGDIEGFTLAGENGKYYPAKARITGERKITVTCPDVEEPKNLTYAFMQYQDFCNAKECGRSAAASLSEQNRTGERKLLFPSCVYGEWRFEGIRKLFRLASGFLQESGGLEKRGNIRRCAHPRFG